MPPILLTQFGAYGDPGRDPRMNVVTVGYLAVIRDVGEVEAGTDAADAALIPVSDFLNGKIDLAFDHLQIMRDAIERVRVELEVTGIATAFVGPTFTLAELRAVYEALWGVELDAANFRRSVVAEDGWVIPTGRRAGPGPAGGRPAELYRAGRAWSNGGPIHRLQRDGEDDDESRRPRPVRAAGGSATRGCRAARARGDQVLIKIHATTVNRTDCGLRRPTLHQPLLHRSPSTEAEDPRDGAGRRGRGGRRSRHRVRGRRPRLRRQGLRGTRGVRLHSGERRAGDMPAGMSFEEAAAVCDGAASRWPA